MTDPTRRAGGPTGPTGSTLSAQTTSKMTSAGQRASSFREALDEANRKRAKANERKRPAEKATKDRPAEASSSASPLVTRPDGTLVVTNPALLGAHGWLGHSATHGAGERGARGAIAQPAVRDAGSEHTVESLAIERVRVGRAGDTVRVHATLGEGQHKGVELRAVERNGKIEVELCAKDSVAAEKLRGELSGLREALDGSGNDRVAVSVVDGSAQSGERGDRPREQDARGQQGESEQRERDGDHPGDRGRDRGRDRGALGADDAVRSVEGAQDEVDSSARGSARWRLL
jgi:hypothetical protein